MKKFIMIIFIFFISGCSDKTEYSDYQVVEAMATFETTSFLKAIDESDLVVTVSPQNTISSNDTEIEKDNNGMTTDAYSLRKFNVKKVLKGSYSDKTINIIEPVYFDTQSKVIVELYEGAYRNIMKPKNDYTVFLSKNSDNSYSIFGAGTSRIDYSTTAVNQTYTKNNDLILSILDNKKIPYNGVLSSSELKCIDTKDVKNIESHVCTKYLNDEKSTYVEIGESIFLIEGKLK
ncbi:MAG: hypothetical protein ACRCUP_02490 [Mycoplasmatales bacterium]